MTHVSMQRMPRSDRSDTVTYRETVKLLNGTLGLMYPDHGREPEPMVDVRETKRQMTATRTVLEGMNLLLSSHITCADSPLIELLLYWSIVWPNMWYCSWWVGLSIYKSVRVDWSWWLASAHEEYFGKGLGVRSISFSKEEECSEIEVVKAVQV